MNREDEENECLQTLRRDAWVASAAATLDEAREVWEGVLSHFPTDAVSLNNLAVVHFHRNDMVRSANLLGESVNAASGHGFLWASLGWVYWHLGREEGCRHAFRAAIAEAPMFSDYGLEESDLTAVWDNRCRELDPALLGRPNVNLLRQSRARGHGALTLRDPSPWRRERGDRPDLTLPRLLTRLPLFTPGGPDSAGALSGLQPPLPGPGTRSSEPLPDGPLGWRGSASTAWGLSQRSPDGRKSD